MALMPILKYPDPRLFKVAEPVDVVDAAVRQLIDDMLETMYDSDGIGLAATQVDVHRRVIVMDTSKTRNEPIALINPEVVAASDDWVVSEEGCLSVPTIYEEVKRPDRVTVRALNRDGEPFTLEADDVTAVCIQHELDHLRGKVFVEYLSPLKRDRIRTRMLKRQREERRF
jgi:peptide deformylase